MTWQSSPTPAAPALAFTSHPAPPPLLIEPAELPLHRLGQLHDRGRLDGSVVVAFVRPDRLGELAQPRPKAGIVQGNRSPPSTRPAAAARCNRFCSVVQSHPHATDPACRCLRWTVPGNAAGGL